MEMLQSSVVSRRSLQQEVRGLARHVDQVKRESPARSHDGDPLVANCRSHREVQEGPVLEGTHEHGRGQYCEHRYIVWVGHVECVEDAVQEVSAGYAGEGIGLGILDCKEEDLDAE